MKLKITVHGVAYEVDVEVLDAGEGFMTSHSPLPAPPMPVGGAAPAVPVAGPPGPTSAPTPGPDGPDGGVQAPIAGTVIELLVNVGDPVSAGQDVIVIEAMKMKTNIATQRAGQVTAIHVAAGDSVREGQALVDLS